MLLVHIPSASKKLVPLLTFLQKFGHEASSSKVLSDAVQMETLRHIASFGPILESCVPIEKFKQLFKAVWQSVKLNFKYEQG